jgi:hypothetical protein
MPNTPTHPVRVEPALWQAALAKARANKETVSAVIRRALLAYLAAD